MVWYTRGPYHGKDYSDEYVVLKLPEYLPIGLDIVGR